MELRNSSSEGNSTEKRQRNCVNTYRVHLLLIVIMYALCSRNRLIKSTAFLMSFSAVMEDVVADTTEPIVLTDDIVYGGNVTVKCKIDNYDLESDSAIWRDGTTKKKLTTCWSNNRYSAKCIPPSLRKLSFKSDSEGISLTIHNVSKTDNGTWICVTPNYETYEYTFDTDHILYPPTDCVVSQSNGSYMCSTAYTGVNEMLNMTWIMRSGSKEFLPPNKFSNNSGKNAYHFTTLHTNSSWLSRKSGRLSCICGLKEHYEYNIESNAINIKQQNGTSNGTTYSLIQAVIISAILTAVIIFVAVMAIVRKKRKKKISKGKWIVISDRTCKEEIEQSIGLKNENTENDEENELQEITETYEFVAECHKDVPSQQKSFALFCVSALEICGKILRGILIRNLKPKDVFLQAINCPQMNLDLYDTFVLKVISGYKDYRNFDMTFTYVLIRYLCSKIQPTKGWGKRPELENKNEGDDIERIRILLSNLYSHVGDNSFKDDFFQYDKILLETIVENFRRRHRYDYRKSFDSNEAAAMRDIDSDLFVLKAFDNVRMCLPSAPWKTERVDAFRENAVQKWVEEDYHFVNTKATDHVRSAIKLNQTVIVSGYSGSGRTAVIHHIALELQKEGYTIMTVDNIEEINCIGSKNLKQVFVLDDPFGVAKLDEIELFNWKKRFVIFETCLQQSKIMLSIQKHFSNEKVFSDLCQQLNCDIVDLNDTFKLSQEEKMEIYCKHKGIENNKTQGGAISSCNVSFFPLLCRLHATEKLHAYKLKDFLENPISTLQSEICRLRKKQSIKYFCLILCLAFGKIDKTFLLNMKRDEENEIRLKACATISNLKTLPNESDIKKSLECLVNELLIDDGECYRFLHNVIYDAVISTIPSKLHLLCLKHFPSKFIRERVTVRDFLSERNDENIQPFIVVSDRLRKAWEDRLVEDMINGNIADVLFNDALEPKTYDQVLLKSVKSRQAEMQLTHIVYDKIPYICVESMYTKRRILEHTPEEIVKMLLFYGDCTPLHIMLAKNLVENFIFFWNMLNDCRKVFFLDSLICIATSIGNSDIVNILLHSDAEVTKCNRNTLYHSPIHYAARCGNENILQNIVNKDNVDVTDEFKSTPLIYASMFGYDRIVKLLIDNGADANYGSLENQTPLFVASENGHASVVEILLNKDVRMNIQTQDEKLSPLIVAARNGYVDIVKLLLEKRANLEQLDKSLNNALIYASKNGHDKIVELLVQNRANVNWRNSERKSAICYASNKGHEKIVNLLLEKRAIIW